MKSYSMELVQRKAGGSGVLGKTALAALAGIGVYYGYKWYKKDKDEKATGSVSGNSYDLDAQEGEDFTSRVLRAARRIIK